MKRRFSFGPPKHTLATASGIRTLPRSDPSLGVAVHAVAGRQPQIAVHVDAKAVVEARGARGEHVAAGDALAVLGHREAPHVVRAVRLVREAGVDDVQQRFVGREREPVRLHEIRGHNGDASALRVDAIDVAGTDFARRGVAFVVRVDAVARIGEPDAAVALDHHVVGRIEPLAVVAIGEHTALAVEFRARHATATVLAGDQATREIDGEAVAVHRGLAEHRHRAIGFVPTQHPVVRNIGPDEIAPCREPRRPFGPAATRVELLDMNVGKRDLAKAPVHHFEAGREFEGHRVLLRSKSPREPLHKYSRLRRRGFGMGCAKQAETKGSSPSRGLRQSRPPEAPRPFGLRPNAASAAPGSSAS